MKIIKIVLIVAAVAVAGVLAFAATKPDTFRVQRAATLKAPPEKIFAAVGQGSMEITEAAPTRVAMNLDFVKPFEAHNKVEFTLQAKGDATEVTWSMVGPVPYFAKILHVFVNMDRMVGGQFEAGLANLKAVTEK